MASYSPKWLTIRRCSYIIACLGICTNPWQITTTAATFIQVSGYVPIAKSLEETNVLSVQVLSGFGTFYGPISGILAADFWIVRKRLIKMRDLYIGNEDSIYWYYKG